MQLQFIAYSPTKRERVFVRVKMSGGFEAIAEAEYVLRFRFNPVPVFNQRRLVLVLLVLTPASAFAYVDPGSGMLIWQGLIAAVGMLIAFVRNPIDVIKGFIERFRRR